MKIDRLNKIRNYLEENEYATLDQLCKEFNVSINTIRRDIIVLEEDNFLKKVYGGVIINKDSPETIPYKKRAQTAQDAKNAIAATAANLISDGDIIIIDAGTTTSLLMPFLKDKNNITIITNNIHVLTQGINYPNLHIVATGGDLLRDTASLIGVNAINFISNLNATKAFMASSGVSIQKGVTNSSTVESEVKKAMMQSGIQKYLLIDNSKFDDVSLVTYANLNDFDVIICDHTIEKYKTYCLNNNIKLIESVDNEVK